MKKRQSSSKKKPSDQRAIDYLTPEFRTRAESLELGQSLRNQVPRTSHSLWKTTDSKRDPLKILEASNVGRVKHLIPVRYGRMVQSPFTFLRGSAALMARDLARTPTTGIQVQACGDCHLLNFGFFATPERNLVFDINDFDETLPAPWEWDLKRLAVSFAVASWDNRFSIDDTRKCIIECVQAYRENLRKFSKMSPLDVWYDCFDVQQLIDMAPNENSKKFRKDLAERAQSRIAEYLIPKISNVIDGKRRLLDQPPTLFHLQDSDTEEIIRRGIEAYRLSLHPERRILFDRYCLEDFAFKVVGIGSVGTRCWVGLFYSPEDHPLLLQFKEARCSVLAPYVKSPGYANEGMRIVVGQRLMQSSSDIFLGWTRSDHGFDFFGRQLRDMKFSVPIEGITHSRLSRYAELCGLTLARAHAKSSDASLISGYLGKSDTFDQAICDFSLLYAEQNARDHAALRDAIHSGRIEAHIE